MSETELEIRPIEPEDKAALAAAVDQSSDEAVYRRFLNPHGRLTASELRYLTEVDHRDHEALLAVDPGSSKSVGVARYVRDRERRDSAEIAVAVLEAWQGRGVGKALLHRLADRARDEGITQFTALMLSDNRPCDGCSRTSVRPGCSAPKRERSSSPSTFSHSPGYPRESDQMITTDRPASLVRPPNRRPRRCRECARTSLPVETSRRQPA
jgi:GNAT superfamily N-acetyltransferase